MCRFWLFKYILWSQWFAFELALLQVSEGYEQKTLMVQCHQTLAWERWLFRDKFNGGLLRTFSKRRHTENFNRPLGISVRFVFKRLYSSITTFLADHPNFDCTTTLFLSDIMFIGCSISTYISMKYTNKGHQDYKT